MLTLVYGIAGLVLLYYGAEFLVRGTSSLALKMKISPLVIGLTLVAYATSAPEMVVSVDAALKNMGDVSIGNVVGSNICNIALILGLSAMITPLAVNKKLLQFDIFIMLGSSLALAGCFYLNSGVNRWQGALLLAGSIAYTLWSIYASRREKTSDSTSAIENNVKVYPVIWSLLMTAGGLAALIGGAECFVLAAIKLAEMCNISQAVIGLTVVAVGTSLPELATSVVAALRKEQDIAIGNVIGSNIFNILAILGVTPLIRPVKAVGISYVDITLMILLGALLYPFMRSGYKISRLEGAALLLIYIAYTTYLILF